MLQTPEAHVKEYYGVVEKDQLWNHAEPEFKS